MYIKSAIVFVIGSTLFTGCIKQHKFTVKVCNGRFYSEVFNVNRAGVDEAFLTDSLTFRIYVGKFDNEHENFSYDCQGDSIIVMKRVSEPRGMKMKLVESKILSVSALVKKKMTDNEPLFEFK